MSAPVSRAAAWDACLPETMTFLGRTFTKVGPHDARWLTMFGYVPGDPARRFAFVCDDFSDDPRRTGLYVVVGLQDDEEPTRETSALKLGQALLTLQEIVNHEVET